MNPECCSELFFRARRGVASEAERAALEAHLSVCSACRLADELVSDFDAVGGADVGDSARLDRIADFAERHVAARRGRGRVIGRWFPMRRLVLAAAAVLVVGGAAAAGSRLWRGSDAGAPEVRASAWLGPASLPLFRAPRAAAPPPSLREAQPAAPAVRVVVPVGARDLYRTANEARRAGDNARAMRVYEDLQRRFPQSPEAGLATVSLGRLLLGGGSAAAALAQFDRCLATSAASRLGAEALYGRGLALAALGRTAEEARTWQRLLAAYPKSPYTAHARRRLETRR